MSALQYGQRIPPHRVCELGTALTLLYAGTGVLLVLSLALPWMVSLQQAILAVTDQRVIAFSQSAMSGNPKELSDEELTEVLTQLL